MQQNFLLAFKTFVSYAKKNQNYLSHMFQCDLVKTLTDMKFFIKLWTYQININHV